MSCKRLSFVLFSFWAWALAGCHAPLLSPAQFTKACAEAIRKSHSTLQVETPRDLQLVVIHPQGRQFHLYLDVNYNRYKEEPKSKREILAQVVEAARTLGGTALQGDRIVPLVKRKEWLQILRSEPGRAAVVYETLTPELIVVYGYDADRVIAYPSEGEFQAAGIDRKNLRSLAVENLKKVIPTFNLLQGEGLYAVAAGGNYEASFVLDPAFWDRFRDRKKGDCVFAIPARDLCFMTGSGDPEAVANLRARAKKAFESSSNRLTPDLLTYREGRLVVLEEQPRNEVLPP
jgi:uncharacterized protein YtpQ (UPF0354 family)